MRTGKVLFAIASDAELRNAKELRKVTMVDDVVDLHVDESWNAPAATDPARPQREAVSSRCSSTGGRPGPSLVVPARISV